MAVDYARFVRAQDRAWTNIVAELTLGRKQTHWMWFVFPQLRGLGRSETAHFFGLDGAQDAQDYAAHPILGERLRTTMGLVLKHSGKDAQGIFGTTDAQKLRSSMTLFETAPPVAPGARKVLDAFYDGERCPATLSRIAAPA